MDIFCGACAVEGKPIVHPTEIQEPTTQTFEPVVNVENVEESGMLHHTLVLYTSSLICPSEYPEYEDAEGEYEEQQEAISLMDLNHSTLGESEYEQGDLPVYEDGEVDEASYVSEVNGDQEYDEPEGLYTIPEESQAHYDDEPVYHEAGSPSRADISLYEEADQGYETSITSTPPGTVLRKSSGASSFKRTHDESDPEGEENVFGRTGMLVLENWCSYIKVTNCWFF